MRWRAIRLRRAASARRSGIRRVTASVSKCTRRRGSRAPGASQAPAPSAGPQLLEIKSPMVGTFYQSPEPAAQPYVKVGSRVNVGQVVCIIEAMKIMNEIESEVAGVIREVTAQNAQPVEFGQVLFRVDPHG